MNEYNDYVSEVRRFLKNYNTFKATVKSLTADIEAQEELLRKADNLGAPIAKYDNMPKGGTGELNTVERQTEDRLRRQERIYKARLNRDELQLKLDQVDRAMGALSYEEQELLRGRYVEGKDWHSLGYENNYSERWAREKAGKALKTLALVICGPKAFPKQLSFVFGW